MAHSKIVTLFDSLAHAQAAERNLVKAGFSENSISIIDSSHINRDDATVEHKSIWQKLFGSDVDDEYADLYSRAIQTNGAILSMSVRDEEEEALAQTILNRHQIVDVSARRQGAVVNTAAGTGTPPVTGVAAATAATATSSSSTQHTPGQYLTGDEPKEEILRLAKEELEVGKRLVREGSTRVRRYVTEEQVSETVNLREQHAEVFRRELNRPVDPKDIDWSEKSVVVEEMAEKPVVDKKAHVVEEVVVKTATTNRDEKVTDTVREQHIDVDKANDKVNPSTASVPPKK